MRKRSALSTARSERSCATDRWCLFLVGLRGTLSPLHAIQAALLRCRDSDWGAGVVWRAPEEKIRLGLPQAIHIQPLSGVGILMSWDVVFQRMKLRTALDMLLHLATHESIRFQLFDSSHGLRPMYYWQLDQNFHSLQRRCALHWPHCWLAMMK